MSAIPVIAIIDVGKTNKKLFLFDEHYKIVYERSAKFIETIDEDGDPCENLESLRLSVFDSLHDVFKRKEFEVKAINFSTYGASFVYIDEDGKPVAPLYNYLKPYPEELKKQFYDTYGGEEVFSYQTASPVLGSLNSGMQLYRIKYERHELFKKIKYALHLPQYMSYLLSGNVHADITSIGCHTNMWDFKKNDYHEWIYKEGIIEKLPPLAPCDKTVPSAFGNNYSVGIGLHDSSAALIPYQVSFTEPFVLISTGTWCISLNPFNNTPLTIEELQQDCLCYMHYQGGPVKASRLFAGNDHEEQVKRIGDHFNQNSTKYKTVDFDLEVLETLRKKVSPVDTEDPKGLLNQSLFGKRELDEFEDYEEAYHQLIQDIITQQYASTQLILKGSTVKRIFVDGGFSKNPIYMNMLASAFPEMEVFAASMAQATAVGTALSIHKTWNGKQLPADIIELKYYACISYNPAF
ncbi:MAG: carbohydrate kinase [Segetibacter sp.]|nr:carbohydrate kinase [Segetibacter sp.]